MREAIKYLKSVPTFPRAYHSRMFQQICDFFKASFSNVPYENCLYRMPTRPTSTTFFFYVAVKNRYGGFDEKSPALVGAQQHFLEQCLRLVPLDGRLVHRIHNCQTTKTFSVQLDFFSIDAWHCTGRSHSLLSESDKAADMLLFHANDIDPSVINRTLLTADGKPIIPITFDVNAPKYPIWAYCKTRSKPVKLSVSDISGSKPTKSLIGEKQLTVEPTL